MASLLMAQMKQVRIASSSGFLMTGKSHVVAMSDPSCQLRRRLSRLPIDGAPELISFPHSDLRRVVVT